MPNIVLGDFDISIIEGNRKISTVFLNYLQILREPTHISGSLIDHIYSQNEFLESFNATSQIVGMNFSNYDAVGFFY